MLCAPSYSRKHEGITTDWNHSTFLFRSDFQDDGQRFREGKHMETVGVVGVGRIGLPVAENLIKSGYRVLGYRRSSLAEFEKIGGVPARSPAEIGAQAEIVFSCLPSSQALEDVVNGTGGLLESARPGQIII